MWRPKSHGIEALICGSYMLKKRRLGRSKGLLTLRRIAFASKRNATSGWACLRHHQKASAFGIYGHGRDLLQGLARDWAVEGEAVRAPLRIACSYTMWRLPFDQALHMLVPGCGLGRLALELAAAGGTSCKVVANDESVSTLAAFVGLLRLRNLTVFPALWSANGLGETGQHLRAAEAFVPKELAAAAGNLHVWHGDFTGSSGPVGFDAVVSAFFLDAVASLPDAISAVARRLRPGGVWVNVGPLRFHHEDTPHFSFAELAALVAAFDFDIEEDTSLGDCEYYPRAFSPGWREVYDLRLLVARKHE
eukprot:gnl/TRDRNA2_/TRDRNA2_162960_c0_seq1.p1 gnl/TRDRNA2_/TRDRNA2_162960_c0~~gnl/TRDRNA2_/TRDRNA2_162960_c0_seq1.p1  ORF type:complete len:306 (-),score=34.27 gnl/TRDRNA2_/TRDRNA2_162960_c0_seq1:56-973(-)